jgi:hypothetical protein
MKRPLGFLLSLALLAVPLPADPLLPRQREWLAKAYRHPKAGWTYLHLEGAADARGFQHGYLLAREIAESLRVRRELWHHDSGLDWDWLVKKTAAMLTPRVDRESLAEIDGIVEGLQAKGVLATTRDEIVAYNAFFELVGYWWPREKDKVGARSPDAPKQSCSSFVATGSMTVGGVVVLGHNTWFGFPEADFNVVADIVPDKGHRILMQTLPGWIHSGTDFFLTDAGLVGSETTIGGFRKFDPAGVPEFARMRRATQDASSIDEWAAVMRKGNNGGYANAWLLGDVKTGEIARLELGLEHVGFEKKKDGFFVGSNVAEDLKILRFETDTNETDIRQSNVARRVRWKQLMKENAGRIDVALAKAFLADTWDAYLGRDNPSGRTLCGHPEMDAGTGGGAPFAPSGAFDAKVVDTALAKQMGFVSRWGSCDGRGFDAPAFLEAHPQFEWMRGVLKSRPEEPWVEFRAGEQGAE